MKRTCAKCRKKLEKIRVGKQRYCLSCHARFMRETRKPWKDLPPAEKRKATARSMANTYQQRGRIKKKPCADCGKSGEEKHHEDYDKALDVIWLCRKCHLRRHAEMKAGAERQGGRKRLLRRSESSEKRDCAKCSEPLSERRIASKQSYCRPCHAAYMRERRAKRRAEHDSMAQELARLRARVGREMEV